MYRFYADKGQISESAVRLTGTDVNHIGNVLRMGKGDELIICDGQGMDYHCIIEDVTAGEVALSVKEKRETDAELPCKVTLFQAVPKRDKMEFLIQKAVELGVHAIVPVFTKRCVVRWDDAKGKRKTERWQAIAEAAAKQSARGVVPRVEEPVRLEEALGGSGDKEALSAKVLEMTRAAGKTYDPEIVKAVSEAERSGALSMTLEEQWRQRRSSRMSAFLHDEEAGV